MYRSYVLVSAGTGATPDYELISCAGYKNCITPNHGIHGVQDMCNLLKRNGKPYFSS